MTRHLGHQFVELLGRHETLSDLARLGNHREIRLCKLQLFLADGEVHHAAHERKIAVDGRVVDVLITALFSKRTEYIRVHLVEPHTCEKFVKHADPDRSRSWRDNFVLYHGFWSVPDLSRSR